MTSPDGVLLRAAAIPFMPNLYGKVYLIGAGPGDPSLIAVRGAELLRAADVVFYDYLAGPDLLAYAHPDAELVCLGRHGHGRFLTQAEINERIVAAARAGKTVVRLKGGDPAIFARVTEELAALEAAGVSYEIVPGISAAQAASAYTGIPLTGRNDASCVAFVTGQECQSKEGDSLDFAALARFPGTLVFYMGLTTAPYWTSQLMQHGKAATTPVAIVRRATFADQQTIFTTLGKATEFLGPGKMRPPAVVIVGDVAASRHAESWFTERPLFGRTVLVTRPAHQMDSITRQFRELGADVLLQPAIEISEPADWSPVDAAIARLADFDWLVFSSSNGVEFFLRRVIAVGLDLRALASCKLAAIGSATVDALARYHLVVDVCPDVYRAEALAEALVPHARSHRFFVARASRGRDVLAEMLIGAGGAVTQAVVYDSRDVDVPDVEVVAALDEGRVDWTTVTSSAIARSLVRMFGDSLRQTKLAAISPLTAKVLTELGHPPASVAIEYTANGILAAILAAESPSRDGSAI